MKQHLTRPPSEVSGFHSLETELRIFSGARIVRVIDAANSKTDQHAHDWPILSLHVVGACRKIAEGGENAISGPSAVLHGMGAPHAHVVGPGGLEQLEIQFDPAWLGMASNELQSMRWWTSGRVANAAVALSRVWRDASANEVLVAGATRRFLELALVACDHTRPPWLDLVERYLEDADRPTVREISGRLGVRSIWLARAYRAAVGEGVHETLRRKRVERALGLLRDSETPAAQVAASAGFCDQSHMIRAFRAVLSRTPREAQRQQRTIAAQA